ncbi:MAG: GspH/FimT family pseudopilin [Planctomycetota bacterium]
MCTHPQVAGCPPATGAPARAPARRDAFSLVELVLIIAILAVMASVAAPRFSNSINRQRLDAAARRIVADLEIARRRAEQASAGQRVVFSAAPASSYRLVGMADPDHPAREFIVQLADHGVYIVTADFGGDAELVFNGYGSPDSGGSIVIQAGRARRTVSLAANGELSVAEGLAISASAT